MKPRLLVISHVLPFPRSSGQQQRVYYKLKALRDHFTIIFLTSVARENKQETEEKLLELCDEVILLDAVYGKTAATRFIHRIIGGAYSLCTGLKFSNYVLDFLEFTPQRLAAILEQAAPEVVLYEYWHAQKSLALFQERRIPTVLDMHNVLWQSRARQMIGSRAPEWWKRYAVQSYRRREETAWKRYDALITINAGEHAYVRDRLTNGQRLFYAPMGTDLDVWPYRWLPSQPPRLAYYGGLGSEHNQQDALACYTRVMPEVWKEIPDAELWIVGSNPPRTITELAWDGRVQVTGFVENVVEILSTMSLVLCPWTGTYGFRSRLIEVMAVGVPVITTEEAVHGMGMQNGEGIILSDIQRFAEQSIRLLRNREDLERQSMSARNQVEKSFSHEVTYGNLAKEMTATLALRNQPKHEVSR